MNESFLHYCWQYQYFNKRELKSVGGEKIRVIHPGNFNTNAGPDFLEGKIIIDLIEWAGSIELHLKSSDYNQHKHQNDKAYNNVILHVVWKHDKDVLREDGTTMPTLELRSLVDESLLKEYQKLVSSSFQIPCSKSFSRVKPLTIVSMIEQALIQRLDEKAAIVQKINENVRGDWEETFYRVLLRNFGFKVNQDAFQELSTVLPLKIIRKNNTSLLHIESLIFGLAGFLEEKLTDPYHQELKKEFEYMSHKFKLDVKLKKTQWRFLRLRPANFPTLRLAQLASILHNSMPLFDKVLSASDLKSIMEYFKSEVSNYWHSHYNFAKSSKGKTYHQLGTGSIENIIINSVAPTLAAYAKSSGEEKYFHNALDWLQYIKPESNSIIRSWNNLGVRATNAFDSQGLIQQMNEYCKNRNCLNCSVGTFLLKP